MEFRNLKANEIDVRVGSVTPKGYTLLLYKNARVDMAILDDTVGEFNWQRDHKEVKGNLYCGIGINVNYKDANKEPMFIWKWDCGTESQFGDKEKGEASDSFKRAGFNWGIGRELYTSPFIFVNCETESEKLSNGKIIYKLSQNEEKRSQSLRVKEISYNDKNEIDRLIIVDSQNIQVYPRINIDIPDIPEIPKTLQGKNYVFTNGKYKDMTIGQVMEIDKPYLELILSSQGVRKDIKDNIREALK